MKSAPKTTPDKELVKVFEAAGVVDFLEYLQSGKRIMWVNFRAGVAKGIGMTVGAALILGITVWILTMLVDLPLVGEYFEEARLFITEYVDRTNYQDEFAEQIRLLQEIEESNKQVTAPDSKVE